MTDEKKQEFEAEDVYESFQNPVKCSELVEYLLNSGLLAEILEACTEYVKNEKFKGNLSIF